MYGGKKLERVGKGSLSSLRFNSYMERILKFRPASRVHTYPSIGRNIPRNQQAATMLFDFKLHFVIPLSLLASVLAVAYGSPVEVDVRDSYLPYLNICLISRPSARIFRRFLASCSSDENFQCPDFTRPRRILETFCTH